MCLFCVTSEDAALQEGERRRERSRNAHHRSPSDQHNENAQVECADFEEAIRETEAGSIDEARWG